MKKTVWAYLLLTLILSSAYTVDTALGEKVQIFGNFTTTWGYDPDRQSSGFTESVDIDVMWDMGEWGDYSSDIADVNFSEPYGMAFISGGLIRFKLNNHPMGSDNHEANAAGWGDDLKIQVMFENAWSKLVFDPFYVLFHADITNFDRQNGFTFEKNQDAFRANWAYIGSRIQKSYILDSNDWDMEGDTDFIENELTTTGVALGYKGDSMQTALSVGTQQDWTTNIDNQYDFAWDIEVKPMESWVINSTVISGANYQEIPLLFGAGTGIKLPLGYGYSLEPYTGFDGTFESVDGNAFGFLKSELAYGLTFTWPGENGWGYEGLFDDTNGTGSGFELGYCNRYSGITLAGNTVRQQSGTEHNAQVTVFEETSQGLIPNLGGSLLIELKNYADPDRELAFGTYAEYEIPELAKPFIKIESTTGDTEDPLYVGVGVDFLTVPNLVLTLRYDNVDMANIENEKGLVRVMAKLGF